MIVVDVNVVVYFFVQGEKTSAARDLMRLDPDWRLPMLWRHEYLNVLATLVREDHATLDEGQQLWRQAVESLAEGEHNVDMEAALALAVEKRISAYDAQYIALARQLGTVCVTQDKRLLAAFPIVTRDMQTPRQDV